MSLYMAVCMCPAVLLLTFGLQQRSAASLQGCIVEHDSEQTHHASADRRVIFFLAALIVL